MMRLEDIQNKTVKNNNLIVAQLEVEALSYPVAGMENGRLAERYFLFPNRPGVKKRRPYAWLSVEAETGRVLQFTHCLLRDFAEDMHVSLDEEIDYGAPMSGSYRKILEAKLEFSSLYEEIRAFVFSDTPDEGQKEKVIRYQELQNQLINKQLLAYYRRLSPEFYQWIEKVI